ncbi:organic cation/carnitine transporter 2-like [Herrania umbratica]|uniref:Organic cation/carnitine transporter 2-like n=1 Tax=Herrania umbratica TaxID=108875 RepID=A0A6J1ANN6_9ROSI|nr:organic cation/carnitine transporter 2-like [Herrania umbratica]
MTDSLQPSQKNLTIDDIIEESLECFGWAQAFQSILVAFASLFDAQNSFISVFTDAQPTFHCIDNTLCISSSNICEIPKFAWAWSDHASKTIISDWELQCSSSFIQGLPVSSHYTGCILGGILLAMYADFFVGREKLLFLSCLTMSVTGILTAFSSNIWMYVIMRFFSGLARGTLVICTVVLLTERMGRNWRGRVGILDYLFFSYSTLSLPVLPFQLEDVLGECFIFVLEFPYLFIVS